LASELDIDAEDEDLKAAPTISVSRSIDPSTFSEANDDGDDDLFGGGLS